MRAFRWIMEFGSIYHIRIVNISVGTTSRDHKEQTDLLEGVEKLWDLGFVVVAAAGNQGPGAGTVTAPGSSRKIITVGSSDMLNGRKAVSGRGPTFDCVCKPDLVAPGSQVNCLCTGTAVLMWAQKAEPPCRRLWCQEGSPAFWKKIPGFLM